jgi:LacI family transcriptional regulator, repressor for deo operon, udp, cdd, tsx, nupC, and nupG
VLCASDQLAIGLASGLHGHGLRVPEDISLVGFDDIQSAEFVIPALTTVRQDRLRLGSRAAELLRAQLSAEHSAKDTVVTIPVTLQIRSSTARPRGD